jgi:PAS domain-containing protein
MRSLSRRSVRKTCEAGLRFSALDDGDCERKMIIFRPAGDRFHRDGQPRAGEDSVNDHVLRKRSEPGLPSAEAEGLYSQLFDVSPFPAVVSRLHDHTVLAINARTAEIIGIPQRCLELTALHQSGREFPSSATVRCRRSGPSSC